MIVEQIARAASTIRKAWNGKPRVGMILGTGLGKIAKEIAADTVIPYESIPHFPHSTVESHAGRLVCGSLCGVPLVAMEGRFHFYEGYSMQEVTFPVRVMKELGCDTMFVSNACGGLNPNFAAGDVMVIEDHINLLGGNPLIGKNDDRLGVRFPDMCWPYDRELLAIAKQVALEAKIVCHQGVYAAVAGPNLETRAEYRFLRAIGSDVVGMSTIPEVIVAVHSKMRVLGLSAITDMCLPDALEPTDVAKIIAVAAICEPKLTTIVKGVLTRLAGPQSS